MTVFSRIEFVKKIGLLSLTLLLCGFSALAQIPKKAQGIADSILQTRMTCPQSEINVRKPFVYDIGNNQQLYQFYYTCNLKKDIAVQLHISIQDDYSKISVTGLPDKEYALSPCKMKARKALWRVAKRNGLKTNFRNCDYELHFEKDQILIRFYEKRNRFTFLFNRPFFDYNYFEIDAVTGVFIENVVRTFM